MVSKGRKTLLRVWLLASVMLVIAMQSRFFTLHWPSGPRKTSWVIQVTTTGGREQRTTTAMPYSAAHGGEPTGTLTSRASQVTGARVHSNMMHDHSAATQMTQPVSADQQRQFWSGQKDIWHSTPNIASRSRLKPGGPYQHMPVQEQHSQRKDASNSSINATAFRSGMQTDLKSDKRDAISGGSIPNRRSLIAPVLEASSRVQNDPEYRRRLQDAASTPINIAVMTGLFWQLPTTHTDGCSVDGIPLDCHIQMGGTEEYLNAADALYYHVPSFAGKPRAKAFPNQLRLAMSLESASYYTNLDRPSYMCQFDAEMTYRTCAQVTNWYSLEAFDQLFDVPPIPFEDKLHAIAYINSNCGAPSGRSDIMRKLMALGANAKVPVHSLGRCDNTKPWPAGKPGKVDVMRKYKFCVAMENSIRQDYMTEKMWDALSAGCIPIYVGSSNADYVVPNPNSFVRYDPAGSGHAASPEELDAVLHEIGSSRSKYEDMLAWKRFKPEAQPSEVFRHLWHARHTTGECFLCQFLAHHRADPRSRYETCLFNKSWMKTAGQQYVPHDQACPPDR